MQVVCLCKGKNEFDLEINYFITIIFIRLIISKNSKFTTLQSFSRILSEFGITRLNMQEHVIVNA